MHGPQFDREYMKIQPEDHGRALDLYRKEALDGGDEELKRFAANVLPALEEHKKLADELLARVED
jgi:putative membrane protein